MKEALIKAIEKNSNFNFYQTIDFKGDVKIIKEIKENKIREILNDPDPDHKIIPLEIKEKYLEGLLYRRDNFLI